jgi:phenylpropionate dioxygenase-like ring-hydroxylating dioxygenase large terminal subunit
LLYSAVENVCAIRLSSLSSGRKCQARKINAED